ncbi:ABC transporter permease [Burkholderia cepacia]|uniref:ABC transporter permease n=1 Tax=Burkholderia cepacia TaxID=292 RepID=UPI001C934A33|nr:ABC transporter permease [Burkholderia cepacia]MBY4709196.1 ABC transporter permease [Burkholderia cepacia]MBY4736263.1 ABC transporter permease [Burkholderia cepacia]MBY4743243.1 ABC transporter permease [Burkholderia cepacia]MBY4756319.1 ABC transporter permease [Burkholderia cepacia]MBY4774299.1 ABC transporter permease [Burkholderia cepacia]
MSTIDPALPPRPPVRDEYTRTLDALPDAERAAPAPLLRRVAGAAWFRRSVIALVLIAVWEIVARIVANDLLVPTFGATLAAFVQGIESGELLVKTGISMSVLLRGYALGVLLAFALTSLAVSTRIGRDLLTMLTSMFNPLPSIALLPIALLWFGLGTGSLLFVLVHAVLWPLALSMYTGFAGVPVTLKMAGRNYGLTGLRQIALILVPAALPSILSGLRVGWAFAWRTLIAAELVFGASAGQGGLGWYIFQNRNELYTDRVFAGLVAVIVIGLLVENLVFDTLERATVRRWGIQH